MKKWMLILPVLCLVLVCGYAMYGTGEEPEQTGGYLLYSWSRTWRPYRAAAPCGPRASGCRRQRRRIRRPWQQC